MRAYVLERYGGPEGSRLMEVPAPMPGPRDILVKVRAAGLNPVDFKFRQGKLRAILRPRLPFVLGNEFAGEVIAVGGDVKRFGVGDRVFARVAKHRAGGFAEQACVDEDHAAHMPRIWISRQPPPYRWRGSLLCRHYGTSSMSNQDRKCSFQAVPEGSVPLRFRSPNGWAHM